MSEDNSDTTGESDAKTTFDGVDEPSFEELTENADMIASAGESLAEAGSDAPTELRRLAYIYLGGLGAAFAVTVLGLLFGMVDPGIVQSVISLEFLGDQMGTAASFIVAGWTFLMVVVALPGSLIRAVTEIVVDAIKSA